MVQAEFHGTQAEGTALVTAIDHNCICEFNYMGARTSTCPPHAMLLEDQRALDGLLFMRWLLQQRMPDLGLRKSMS